MMIKNVLVLLLDPVSPQEEAIGFLVAFFGFLLVIGFIWGGGCLIKKATEKKNANGHEETVEDIDKNKE